MSVHNTGAAGDGSQLGLGDSVCSAPQADIIWLGSGSAMNANAICAQLLLLMTEDRTTTSTCTSTRPARLGDGHGMAIYILMQYIKPDVSRWRAGRVDGQFLLTAGAPGKRFSRLTRACCYTGPGWRWRFGGRDPVRT